MFTIKAVTEGAIAGGDRIQLYSAERVRICPAGAGEQSSPRQVTPVGNPVEFVVHLMDEKNSAFETLEVGGGSFLWNMVYVINEKGRTVQTVRQCYGCGIAVEPPPALSAGGSYR